jgi:hypothetical protein
VANDNPQDPAKRLSIQQKALKSSSFINTDLPYTVSKQTSPSNETQADLLQVE